MELEKIGRWCLLGAYMKQHGTNGVLKLNPPERVFQTIMRVDTFDNLMTVINGLPNVTVDKSLHTITIKNWHKYQVDSSKERVAEWRKCNDARREEKRGDKKRREKSTDRAKKPFVPPTPDEATTYAESIGYKLDGKKFVAHYAAAGWKRGNTKITNWKMCVQTWKHNDNGNGETAKTAWDKA